MLVRLQIFLSVLLLITVCSCKPSGKRADDKLPAPLPSAFLVVLGIAQDAGYPQIGCEKDCCKSYWEGKESRKYSTCLALVDKTSNRYWIFEATPDITPQLHEVQKYVGNVANYTPNGIFITHAHIGHYAGLMFLGREAMGAKNIPVYAMPRLDTFLRSNGPWSQLVALQNIDLIKMTPDSSMKLSDNITVTPIKVPHRDEYSETAGFEIQSGKKKVLFIPDIDKWNKWERDIAEKVSSVDLALLDGTFYKDGEIKGRSMSEIPHPFVEETMQLFSSSPNAVKQKIKFIHFNHTNPLLKAQSPEKDKVKANGFSVAFQGEIIEL
ncbi:pyrroloquinoline quinone biosynthesis protein PqqB [Pseudoflavitalea sp. G-6-1-2]|uniref:MBL fold metallo-hydrolase n=1 Tax=Pseudoflavitalea sp. G-6-1-2 TaxID=2728841 RepID=UPI00146D0715|nr:MBL fold metallo-hydrolase [Pseudoflavitalea sp. G-6-1-2]NML23106.1 pyrroloquinoline quinone biosynthesis protein PqqB [Pseudoflavitalea sp. G-6-1-2]